MKHFLDITLLLHTRVGSLRAACTRLVQDWAHQYFIMTKVGTHKPSPPRKNYKKLVVTRLGRVIAIHGSCLSIALA